MTMRACQNGPIDTAPLTWDGLTGLHRDKGEGYAEGNLSAPISLLFIRWCEF